MHGGDGEATGVLVQCHFGAGIDAVRGHPCFAQLQGQSHGETAGVSGPDQLLGVGTGLVFEAGVEAVGRVLECTALGGNAAFAVLDAALPVRGCGFLDAHELLLVRGRVARV